MSARRVPRVAVVGARRVRQGTGPFVARHLAAAGARVTCVLGTTAASAAEAARALRAHGLEARPYADVEAMLSREALDALAVCSPAESHGALLDRALDAGLHVLCEKPLLGAGPRRATRAAGLAAAFAAAGRVLAEACQWPYTLDAFRALHPDAPPLPPARFAMSLAPAAGGARGLEDALSHPLSLLQALAPGAGAHVAEAAFAEAADGALAVRFAYRAGGQRVAAELSLRPTDAWPRPASYAVDGRAAHRRVRPEDYALFLEDRPGPGARRVALADPTAALVRDFVEALQRDAAPPPDPRIAARQAMLDHLLDAYQEARAA